MTETSKGLLIEVSTAGTNYIAHLKNKNDYVYRSMVHFAEAHNQEKFKELYMRMYIKGTDAFLHNNTYVNSLEKIDILGMSQQIRYMGSHLAELTYFNMTQKPIELNQQEQSKSKSFVERITHMIGLGGR